MDEDYDGELSAQEPLQTGEPLQWHSPTHVHTRRSNDWYWALGILALCGAVASVFFGNLLFAVIIALAAIAIITMAARPPREHEVIVTDWGIIIDRELYPYEKIRSFWITDYAPVRKLILTTSALIHPHIAIVLPDHVEPDPLRAHLEQFIAEEAGHPIGTLAAEFLGF